MWKRGFDIFASSLGLLVTSPVYLLVGLAIKLDSPGPVFYRQVRVGRGGKHFRIFKFRTMVVGADRQGPLSTRSDRRVTRVGRWLRRFEIDEMPTLINVLLGDMSIVGPRPELPRYVDLYSQEQRQVLSVRPGMTDLGTLRFRNETELMGSGSNSEQIYLQQILPEKINLNLEYVRRQSLWFDFYVIFATLFLIVRQKKG